MARRSASLLHLGHYRYVNIFGHLVYGTFGRHYCRRNGLKFLSPKWLVTKGPCPAKSYSTTTISSSIIMPQLE